MEKLPQISILMPSLNVRPYIEQCMDSVLGQTMQDLEILCIDAGSSDGTLEILREYEEADPRVRLILSDKKSYGYQMNLGLDAARGEYIGIVETDDWAEPDMFSTLWEAAEDNKADMVKANYYWYYTKPQPESKPFENLKNCAYETVFSPREMPALFRVTPAIWSGLYRKSMLLTNQIRFNETPGASYQDTSFYFMVCTAAERVFLINSYLLHYRRDNENSSVNSSGKLYCLCDEMEHYESFLARRPEDRKTLYPFYLALKYEKYRWNYARLAAQLQWTFLQKIREDFLAHRSAGQLEVRCFSEHDWRDINTILDDPLNYFKSSCKCYFTRPKGPQLPEGKLLRPSAVSSPDVSIIIPVYSDEDHLARSVESAQKQSHGNIEILCIDDGSKDESLRILLDYAQRDERMAVFSQVNQGQASARNVGMTFARGKYIQFLDSDDALREDAIEMLLAMAEEKELDILYFDGESIFAPPQLQEQHHFYLDAYRYDWEPETPLRGQTYFCRAMADHKYRASVCMALYRRQFLERAQLRFVDGVVHEDNAFSQTAVLLAERVWHTRESCYRRLVRPSSTMTRKRDFFHLYGYLVSAQNVMQLAQTMEYEEMLDRFLAEKLARLLGHVRAIYRELDNPKDCRAKLTHMEETLLDMALQAEPERQGGAWAPSCLLRRICRGFRCIQEHGLGYTINYLCKRILRQV